MTVKGYTDFAANHAAARERAKVKVRRMHGADHVPPGGWDAYFGEPDLILDFTCELCGQPAAELLPYGPNHESICEACAAKNPTLSESRWKEGHPRG